jgi:MFS family permease
VAFFGIGAAVCGFGLSILRRLLSTDWIARSGGFAFALANVSVASAHHVYLLWIATFLAGAGWVAVTATFNSSAQLALPGWVRARALSLYLLALQGGLALGSLGWGYVASQFGIRDALDAADNRARESKRRTSCVRISSVTSPSFSVSTDRAKTGNEIDFYEVRFNRAFYTFRIARFRPELDRIQTVMLPFGPTGIWYCACRLFGQR